jgi:hypothetical protein
MPHPSPALEPPSSTAGGRPEADGHPLELPKPTSVTSGLWAELSPPAPPRVPRRHGVPLRPGNRPPPTEGDFLRAGSPLCPAPLSAPPQTASYICRLVTPSCPRAPLWHRGMHWLPQRHSPPLLRPAAVNSLPPSCLNMERHLSEPLSPRCPKLGSTARWPPPQPSAPPHRAAAHRNGHRRCRPRGGEFPPLLPNRAVSPTSNGSAGFGPRQQWPVFFPGICLNQIKSN